MRKLWARSRVTSFSALMKGTFPRRAFGFSLASEGVWRSFLSEFFQWLDSVLQQPFPGDFQKL